MMTTKSMNVPEQQRSEREPWNTWMMMIQLTRLVASRTMKMSAISLQSVHVSRCFGRATLSIMTVASHGNVRMQRQNIIWNMMMGKQPIGLIFVNIGYVYYPHKKKYRLRMPLQKRSGKSTMMST